MIFAHICFVLKAVKKAFSFNSNGIVYDNTPWRPGKEMDFVDQPVSDEDERKMKNVATRITSNGVELLVKDKNADNKQDQRKVKYMHIPPAHMKLSPTNSLLSSAVATYIKHQHLNAMFPLHPIMQHNYIIKTCMTTYTYLTTVIHNKRSAISTFETIVSVVTTESLTNLFATDLLPVIKPTKTKYMEVKTIQPSIPSNIFVSSHPKIDKRIDSEEDDSFDVLQPSEPSHFPCTTSCSCSHTKTEGLKTKYTNVKHSISAQSKYGTRPTKVESFDKTKYSPYEYENSQLTPTDRIVEKYTEVVSDYSDEKDSNSVEETELLTNEQAPQPTKNNKNTNNKTDKNKQEKPQKLNKNKVLVADLLKLGSLGIKGLSQLAPVFEKMTGGFIRRQNANKTTTTTTTTVKPPEKLTPYHANQRIDSDIDSRQNFPIYIPVDELETSESQLVFKNATLHQNLAWAVEHKQPKAHYIPPKIVHESPLVNGGIPISPGEIIRANSDVIVGKPAVGGPLTLAASGIKLHNPVNPPPVDSLVAGNEQYAAQENPTMNEQVLLSTKIDDSFDLRPPEMPKPRPNRIPRPAPASFNTQTSHHSMVPSRLSPPQTYPHPAHSSDHVMKTEQIQTTSSILGNHGRPAFLDYIPALGKPTYRTPLKQHVDLKHESSSEEMSDNSPSSSEVINTRLTINGDYAPGNSDSLNKPLLVDIQPSRVANVIIPHGSSTALVFAGSSEPHKTGQYIDDPLPYPEPGYFGSFSIDAPKMTNVHSVGLNSNKQQVLKSVHPHVSKPAKDSYKPINLPPINGPTYRNDLKFKWKENKRPGNLHKIPPPTSNQETHVQVGPQITVYNPDLYRPNNGDLEKYNHVKNHSKGKDGKEIIDKDYEKYLAVPPPPPKMHFNHDHHHYDKTKPYNQRPVVHIKPVQDMKVFFNIQHPISTTPKSQPIPPKVTSEIYFASQAPNGQPSPTYTIHVPAAPNYGNHFNSETNNANKVHQYKNVHSGTMTNTFSVVSSPNFTNKSIFTNDVKVNDKDNTYTVTLNTATNVANHIGETGQVIGSSVPVAINANDEHANIPIGTNFAIRVEDKRTPIESLNLHKNIVNSPIVYDEHGRVPPIGDNRWNKSTEYYRPQSETTISGNHYYNQIEQNNNNVYGISNQNQDEHSINSVAENHYYEQHKVDFNKNSNNEIQSKTSTQKPKYDATTYRNHHYVYNTTNKPKHEDKSSPNSPQNSHANFPMINEDSFPSSSNEDVKPVTEEVDEKTSDQKRPGKLIPNIPTNSHGWYSSILQNENSINNIKVEVTTRKSIPLTYDYNKNNAPDFGQKITSVGKPPSGYWPEDNPVVNNFNVGKPFSKVSTKKPSVIVTPVDNKPYLSDYISTFGSKQPVYDIPIRDNSDETTTAKSNKQTLESVKPVYENSDEIYDGEEEIENGDSEGAISQESMKVPVVTSSHEDQYNSEESKSSTEKYYDQDKVNLHNDQNQNEKNQFVEFNPGTQTEKPFGSNNNTYTFHSNAMRPIYENTVKPKPFTMDTHILDHQLQQPHWQINQLMVNSSNASYEESLDLNIGEEMVSGTRKSTPTPLAPSRHKDYDNSKYRRPQGFSYSKNDTRVVNRSNIITSTVHINDKKPLIVEEISVKTTSPPISLTVSDFSEKSSSEIIDLSPPPPTMDYSFKPSTNDEMIMGMSPPPPIPSVRPPIRTQPTPRPIPIRTPPPYRTKPPRTLPPKVSSTPRPIRRPINRDEVSTYRPSYDILNNDRRPVYNKDQPSSQLLPPPREIPTKVASPINELPSPALSISSVSTVIFPTPTSSGWLTSSGIGFSTKFDFEPTSVYFPGVTESSKVHGTTTTTSTENSYSYEVPSSSESGISQTPSSEEVANKEAVTESITNIEEQNVSYDYSSESSKEDISTEKYHITSIPHRNRTRKPYPIRHDDKKQSTYKYRPSIRPSSSVIKPSKTLTRPEILYPTRYTTTRKILRPVPTRSSSSISSSIIESSESSVDDEFVKPTETLKEDVVPTPVLPEVTRILSSSNIASDSNIISLIKPSIEEPKVTLLQIHHAGNEVKISDEIVPTKTEFRTTVVTLTKTLSEPPSTVSSIGFVNLTHTLTVTHTKTSLVSKSEGAVTQTLILTNTHTSTIVDVVTKVHTQVQPTTIVETVTKHIPIIQVDPTPVHEIPAKTKKPLDDLTMSSEEENFIIRDNETTENIHKVPTESEGDNDTFFVVMNKSQNGGKAPPISTDIETGEYDITRNEQVHSNGVSQVLFGEILLAGTPYLETNNIGNPTGIGFGKECQPDCKASRNERCQRIDGIMKCVCRPGFARMFPDRPCKPTYTYSVKLALGSQGNQRLKYHENLADNSTKEYHALALATHEGINRMVMQSDLRDVYHGVHITGFHPVEIRAKGEAYQGVMNEFYVQLSDNAHESRLKEVIEKYLRNNNYSLGGTEVHAAGELMERLEVSDFDECTSGQFHDCSEHAQCFNLRGTYTCSCLEGFADLSVNTLYPGRICSAEPVGCELCNYHGTCYTRDDKRVLCECFQWYGGSTCHINLKVVLISLVVAGALLSAVLAACAVVACRRPRTPRRPRSIVTCIQAMPALHQGAAPSKQRADRRALINDRGDGGDSSSLQNASLPYMPTKNQRQPTNGGKKCVISEPPAHDPPPPPAPAVMIPRARLHPHHSDSRENISRKKSMEQLTSVSEAKLISYLESGAVSNNDEMRRKYSAESSYSANKDRHHTKQGALVSAGFKVSTTVRPDDNIHDDRDDTSSVNKADLEAELAHLDALRKSYSHEDLSEWTDAERRIGELTLSEARSVGGTLPASTGRAASSTRMTHQEANTMAERDLGSTFMLPHVHLYKPDLTSDVSEFDSL